MARMMRLYFTLRLLQLVVPTITRAIHFILALMWIALISLWVGVPQAADRIAEEWTRRLIARGIPTIWDHRTNLTIRVMAFLTIVAGWILLAFITVFIVKWIF